MLDLNFLCNKIFIKIFNIFKEELKIESSIEEVSKELTEIANEIFSQEIKFINDRLNINNNYATGVMSEKNTIAASHNIILFDKEFKQEKIWS